MEEDKSRCGRRSLVGELEVRGKDGTSGLSKIALPSLGAFATSSFNSVASEVFAIGAGFEWDWRMCARWRWCCSRSERSRMA
jgi:hypothetical protein